MIADATPPPTPRPRRPPGTIDSSIPRHWFGGNAVATHLVNGVNLLFPAGERFFVRSVRHYLDRLDPQGDAELLAQVRGFAGQEGWHAQAHEAFFRVLEEQGYRLGPFLDAYQRISFHLVERLAPPRLRLAVTVAAEHFTATLADNVLSRDVLASAHPALRDLLLWHAAEEIEHKHVAFDVLRRVDDSYALRMAGLGVGTVLLCGFWLAATVVLLRQDRLGGAELRRQLRVLRQNDRVLPQVFGPGLREYLRRDFDPRQHDNYHLARAYLERGEPPGSTASIDRPVPAPEPDGPPVSR